MKGLFENITIHVRNGTENGQLVMGIAMQARCAGEKNHHTYPELPCGILFKIDLNTENRK